MEIRMKLKILEEISGTIEKDIELTNILKTGRFLFIEDNILKFSTDLQSLAIEKWNKILDTKIESLNSVLYSR